MFIYEKLCNVLKLLPRSSLSFTTENASFSIFQSTTCSPPWKTSLIHLHFAREQKVFCNIMCVQVMNQRFLSRVSRCKTHQAIMRNEHRISRTHFHGSIPRKILINVLALLIIKIRKNQVFCCSDVNVRYLNSPYEIWRLQGESLVYPRMF